MDLLSYVATKETVKVGEHEFSVSALSIEQLAQLCVRFPGVLSMFAAESYNPADILASGAASAMIAAALGYPGNDQAEQRAATFPATGQLEILAVAIEKTLPGGARPFAERIARLVAALSGPETPSENLPKAPISSSAPDTTTE